MARCVCGRRKRGGREDARSAHTRADESEQRHGPHPRCVGMSTPVDVTRLNDDILASVPTNPLDELRTDIEDTTKEYRPLDLLVELLQNGLDAIDERRYRAICAAAGRNPSDQTTVASWNAAVLEALERDFTAYDAVGVDPTAMALHYRMLSDTAQRRFAWWRILGDQLQTDGAVLAEAAARVTGRLRIVARVGDPAWIEIEDNGIGMPDVLQAFIHKQSSKRPSPVRPRRYGVRGNHGWGLTAVLAFSDRVEVLSRIEGAEAQAYAFIGYSSFAAGRGSIENLRLGPMARTAFSAQLRGPVGASGTHVRAQVATSEETDVLAYTLAHFSHAKFERLLRLYTPIGQFNDYVFHPAFHTVRRDDLVIECVSEQGGQEVPSAPPFDAYRLDEVGALRHQDYKAFVDAGQRENTSVHTVHRSRIGSNVYLSAADIQDTDWFHAYEKQLVAGDRLPTSVNEDGEAENAIPRGFIVAFSGGMVSEYLAKEPRGNNGNFRGVVLAETTRPTLGRKHVLDQRTAIPKAAQSHITRYESVRSKTLIRRQPTGAGTPASARWRRDFIVEAIDAVRQHRPVTADLQVWASPDSAEGRVALAFGELLGRGNMGEFRVLRCHLPDVYDFVFLQRSNQNPLTARLHALVQDGYATYDGSTHTYLRYGIGEFKAEGHRLLNDLVPTPGRKNVDTPDLLVCWDFDPAYLEERDWTVNATPREDAEYPLQTHEWRAPEGRGRSLPVIALGQAITTVVGEGALSGPPEPWPGALPDYYS